MKTRFITFLLLFVMNLGAFAQSPYPVSYTHLTLPTICSV